MSDKKSVVVIKFDDESVLFKGSDDVSYAFEIGENNGVLVIVEKRAVSSVLSVPDEEDVIMVYAPNSWDRVYGE